MKNFSFLISVLSVCFCVNLSAQQSGLTTSFKGEIGLNRSELIPTPLKSEDINGGVGWGISTVMNIGANKVFGEIGLGYRSLNFLISEEGSQVRKFSTKVSSVSVPVLIGTNIIGINKSVTPILETGFRFDYTLGFSNERTDVLKKSDLRNLNMTYELDLGFRMKRIEFIFGYNRDLIRIIKLVTEKNKYVGLKLGYYFSK